MRFVLVFVVQADGLPVGETELVDQPVAEHQVPVAHGKVVPIARILGHAVHGDRLRARPLAAIVFQRIHGILFGLRDFCGAVIHRVHGVHRVGVGVDVGGLVNHVQHVIARFAQFSGNIINLFVERILGCGEIILRTGEGILRVGCGLHGLGRRGSRQRSCRILQRIGCRLERISRGLQRIAGIFRSGQLVALHALQFANGRPCIAIFLRALDFQRRLQRVHMLGDHVVVQVLGVMRHGRQNCQREQQQHAGEPDSHEQRGEIAQVAQEHPHAEARGKAQALGQGKTALDAAFAGFVAQKLQRGVTHLAQKPQQRDAHERRHGQHGGLREHAPAPGGVVRRQAVAAVIQVAHRLAHQGVAGHVAYHGRRDAHRRGQRQVVRHQLAATITAGQQRADDRAFLLDGARRQHHEHERHDGDDHVQQHAPHGGVA